MVIMGFNMLWKSMLSNLHWELFLVHWLLSFSIYLHVMFSANFGGCLSMCDSLDSTWKDVL